jgi:hypothetical protein
MLLPGRYKGTRRHKYAQPRTLEQIIGEIFKVDWRLLDFRTVREKENSTMPDRDKYFQSGAWLKAKDVKNGQLLLIEEFGEAKTKIGLRPYVKFKGYENPFGLNATNFDQLTSKFGDNEKNWIGKKVKVVLVQAANPSQGGKMQPSIRFE